MGGRWNPIGFQFLCFLVLIISLEIQGSWSLNAEGLALLEFRARVNSDPYGVFANWNPNDSTPCSWSGVHCLNGRVQILDMKELYLEGTLAPELGKLSHLRFLILYKNHFSGAIPKEFGKLTRLELLDLRNNKLRGKIPVEIGEMLSLKRLLLCNNEFEGSIPLEHKRLNLPSELQFDDDLISAVAAGIRCVNRKFGHCLKQLNKAESLFTPINGVITRYLNALPLPVLKLEKDSLHIRGDRCCTFLPRSSEAHMAHDMQNFVNVARRKLFEKSTNLQAEAATGGPPTDQITALPTSRSSGTFPAVPNAKKKQYPSSTSEPLPGSTSQGNNGSNGHTSERSMPTSKESSTASGNIWRYVFIIPGVTALLIIAAAVFFVCQKRAKKTIGPWETGLSGQLQKALVTGVPKLNRSELDTACEDFSNIINTLEGCIVYKGTLSSGVEIAVSSTRVTSAKDWLKCSQMAYRKQIDTLSRINHKNFVNLIGYCEEDEPFNRMMVFEYAPNGTVFEHLHVKEMEHLDWNTRMRIIMGTAYCLQYMHHDLNPPVAHSNLTSNCIFLTDDYAAKVTEICFPTPAALRAKVTGDVEFEHSVLPPMADLETNVHSFGILLLEIISGKLPKSEEHEPLEKWAAQYLNDKPSISNIIDPTLKSFKNNELDVICGVINDCIQPDPRQRPTMNDIVAKLRQVTNISPDQATPRLSPLWWAELEILSAETN